MKKTKDEVSDVDDSVGFNVEPDENVDETHGVVPPHMLDAIKSSKHKTAAEKAKATEQKEVDSKVREDREEAGKKPGFTKVTSVTSAATPASKKEVKAEDHQESKKKKTPIWDSLKDRKISVFSLPVTDVSYHLAFISETPTSMIGGFQIPALISTLESNFGKEFEFTVFDKKKVEIKKK